jgi:hypothetical protein
VALDAEDTGLVVQLLGHVLADALELATARAGGAGWFMVDLAARQVVWKLGALGLALLAFGGCLGRELLEFTLQCFQVGVDRFFEQALLLGVEVFALGGELQPLEHRHLVRDLVDRRLLERDLAVADLDLPYKRSHDLAQLLRVQGLELCLVDHQT